MDLFEVIKTRRTIHSFVPAEISKETLHKAFEAANLAPNHKLTFPWRFTVAGPKVREQLTELVIKIKKQKIELSEIKEKALRDKFNNPSFLIAVQRVKAGDPFRAREDYAAVACAIQNMSLYLWSEGIGTKWSTGAVTRHEKTYQLMGVDPSEKEIVGFFWVGKFKVTPPTPKRPKVESLYNFTN